VPEITGSAEFDGGAVTIPVCADVADADPPALLAVTTTSTVSLTSEAWSM
jgi:hypothetical protein